MIVRFTDRQGRELGRRVMDAVPRAGEVVRLDDETMMVTWNIAWDLGGSQPAAWVSLRTLQQYERDVSRSIRRDTQTSAEAASLTPGSSPRRT